MKIRIAQVLGLTLTLSMAFGCEDLKPKGAGKTSAVATKAGGSTATKGAPYTGKKVKMELYVMSKCPYGVKAVQGMKPVLDEIGSAIDLDIQYIAYMKNGKWAPMHGDPEHKGNIVQLCAMKHYPARDKYMPFFDCWNKNWRQIPAGWEACAKSTGLDVAKLQTCYTGGEGEKLATASYVLAKSKKASGSPTIYVGGEKYSGGRSKNDYLRAICNKLTGAKPAPCANIPEPVEVNAIVLTDKRCKKCNAAGMLRSLRGRFFPKLTVKTIDYASTEGKALYKELGIKHLPIYLFTSGVEKADKYASIKRWMLPKGKYKQLRAPANFDPTAEICDNKQDDTNNGKVDCDDPTCTANMVCRKEIAKKLDVFIMSQCPYGVKAIDSMKEVLNNFGSDLAFDVHYIADKQGDGFKALHGQPEVDENIRQLCAKKYYKKNNKYLDYLWCRNKNYRSNDWKPCATAGISAAVIEKCFNGEGKKLLEEDIKIAKSLGVGGSPTWLANNRHKFSGIAADAIKKNVCQHNGKMANCDKKLTEKAAVKGSCN